MASSTVQLTVVTSLSEQVFFYELSSADSLDTLRLLLESESGVAVADQVRRWLVRWVSPLFLLGQVLVHNGKALQGDTLAQAGLVGDVQLMLVRRQDLQQQQAQPPQRLNQQQPQQQGQQQQAQDPATLMEVIRNDPTTIEQLSRSNPQLLEAALSSNLERFSQLLAETQQRNAQGDEMERREEEYQRLLASADPFDPVAQGKIAEYIRQKNVEGNYVNAMEHNPEAFASVSMLYISCKVNGVPMKAFVDSGAQSTIMSEKCAEACNILHLLDTRFAGVARGVGEAKILGRIHMADLIIGKSHFVSSFTVMQQTEAGKHDLDFLLGLDNLKRHQSVLDLKEGVLRIGEEVTPFLAEKDIPGHGEHKSFFTSMF